MDKIVLAGLALAWGAIVAGCWLGWQLLRQNGRLLLQLEELEKRLDELEFGEGEEPDSLPLGSTAPEFSLPDLAGQTRTLGEFRGKSVLLIFFNPACGYCRELLPKLAALTPSAPMAERAGLPSEVLMPEEGERRPRIFSTPILVISTGDAETNRHLFNEHRLVGPVLLQKETEVAALYKANGTPSGYLINPEGKISSRLAIGADALLEIAAEPRDNLREKALDSAAEPVNGNARLQEQSHRSAENGEADGRTSRFANRSLARSKLKRDGLKTGTPAPDFRLPRLDGRGELALSELRGRRVLLVFSSPGCGPCNALAPELEKFHRAHLELEVLLISKGEPKENRAKIKEYGLTFPIVLQQQWEISRRYAMFATPIAYLIDEHGIISHDVAVGVEPILALIAGVPRGISAQPELASA
jgi:peroxiredoxin